MDSEPKQKELKNDGIDRISDLPDSILCQILSYVPTKNAVGTSILSTRWKNLFPVWIPPVKLDLDDSFLLHPENEFNSVSSYFIHFVDRLLNETLIDGPPVEIMILNCKKYYSDANITSWVSAALRLKLRQLKLMVSVNNSWRLFHSLDGCTTLVKLEFCNELELYALPDEFSLPNLKELSLTNITCDEETGDSSINQLISGCPALEDLCIRSCDFRNVELLYIESLPLKKLTIQDSWNDSTCELEIYAPFLETLFYSDTAAGKYHVHNYFYLVEAHINVGPNQRVMDEIVQDGGNDEEGDLVHDTGVAKMVIACSTAARLYLSSSSIVALNRSHIQLPNFRNLTWLLMGCIGLDEWKLLSCLLHNAPNLEKLTLEEGFSECKGGFEIFELYVPGPPLCLKLNLKEIDYWAFKEEEDEIKLIEYFLNNGERLEKLKLHWLPFKLHWLPFKELSNLSELLKLPGNYTFQWTDIENGMQISIRRTD